MAKLNYDTENVQPAAPAGLWPQGKHEVEVTGADVKPTKSGSGEYIEIEFSGMAGPMASRKIWGRFNVTNDSPEAERIGREQFAALHNALGLKRVEDTDQLIGRALVIEVGIGKRKDNGEDENRIRGYYPAAGAPGASATPKPAASAGKAAAPWEKKTATA